MKPGSLQLLHTVLYCKEADPLAPDGTEALSQTPVGYSEGSSWASVPKASLRCSGASQAGLEQYQMLQLLRSEQQRRRGWEQRRTR
jgi:hypothetical protein